VIATNNSLETVNRQLLRISVLELAKAAMVPQDIADQTLEQRNLRLELWEDGSEHRKWMNRTDNQENL
jgi:hypothetical protein